MEEREKSLNSQNENEMEVQQAWQNAIENITNIQIENKNTQNVNDYLQDSQSMTQTQKLTENRPNWAMVMSTIKTVMCYIQISVFS